MLGLLRRLLDRQPVPPHEPDERASESVSRYADAVEKAYRELPKDPPPEIYREIERAEQVLKRERRGA